MYVFPWNRRQKLKDYIHYAWQLISGWRSRGEQKNAERRWRDISVHIDTNKPLDILDLGNGRLRPQYILLKAEGHRVYGIDLANGRNSSWVDIAYRIARLIFVLRIGLPPSDAITRRTLVCGEVDKLPFAANSFDLVTSVAAFEHFLDVPSVVAELYRVLRPKSIAWVQIHLFTSLSGGHNLRSTEIPLKKIPEGVDPWDHLRQRRIPFRVPLNEWRRGQYLEQFSNRFEILKQYCPVREGEELLTPEIEDELSAYQREELTSRSYVIVARKLG